MDNERITSANISPGEIRQETTLRPQTLDDYIGQREAKENLKIYMDAALGRGETLDHVLFSGPPGLGKTTLSYILGEAMGVNVKTTSGPVITKPGEPVDLGSLDMAAYIAARKQK